MVTPAAPRSRKGNRVTAVRWAYFLRQLGHRVQIVEAFAGQPCDLLVALHADKSSASVARYARERPGKPLFVALTGTDLYRDIQRSRRAVESLEQATRLILLQPDGIKQLPRELRTRTRVIFQSAERLEILPEKRKSIFEVCVAGHLRPVKDPFRAAMAARQLPPQSRVRITHIGAALTEKMAERAETEMARNRRYRWLGEVPRYRARRILARSRLLVLSSKMEGGANVLSEAVVAGVPVLATRISGSIGMLGEDYPGFFPVGATRELRRLLQRCEEDSSFHERLRSAVLARQEQFDPRCELKAWSELLDEVGCGSPNAKTLV